MDRTDVVQAFVDGRGLSTYLELGLGSGRHFLRVRAQRKIGVDPASRVGRLKRFRWWFRNGSNRGSRIFRLTSDAFFAAHRGFLTATGLDVAFVDGLHTCEQSLRDVENCLAVLNPRGVVLLHDCSPPSAAAATPARSLEEARRSAGADWDGSWCGDVYKTVLYLRSQRPDLRVCVLDCDRGIGVVERGSGAEPLQLGADAILALGYPELAAHREEWLDLRPAESLHELVRP